MTMASYVLYIPFAGWREVLTQYSMYMYEL
jgi:hypothetical protein